MVDLTTDPAARKGIPVATGFLDYFPDAVAYVAQISKAGNDQHNPGQPLHWSRDKSNDHADCAARHMLERGTLDTDGLRHTGKLAWRVLAMLQLEIEAERTSVGPLAGQNSPPPADAHLDKRVRQDAGLERPGAAHLDNPARDGGY